MDERQDDPASAHAGWPSRIAAYAFALLAHGLFLILAIVGPFTIKAMIRESRSREIETAAAIIYGVRGLILTAIGFGFFLACLCRRAALSGQPRTHPGEI
jgi:multisubunit Na+/H+ antiporter MnhC subunit